MGVLTMVRRVALVLVVGGLVAGGLAGPAGAATFHDTEDVTGDTIACQTATYTITSGVVKGVFHEGESASGNHNFTGTLTPQRVTAVSSADPDGVYSIQGALWFGSTSNAQQGTEQGTFTGKLQITKKGEGTVDSVNVTFHVSPNGDLVAFDFGTCAI